MCPFLLILRCIFPDLFHFSGINEKMRQNSTYFIAYTPTRAASRHGSIGDRPLQISSAPVGDKMGAPLARRAHWETEADYTVGWLAASMIFTNFSGTREAPPMRPPSMSGCASSSKAFFSFMEPP